MKIRELIEVLQELDGDTEVFIRGADTGLFTSSKEDVIGPIPIALNVQERIGEFQVGPHQSLLIVQGFPSRFNEVGDVVQGIVI